MFCTNEMEYGTYPMDFPIPDNFAWVYPTRCGYHAVTKSPAVVSSQHSGLYLYILSGEGEAEIDGRKCGYMKDCVLTAADASKALLYPLEETTYLYVLLEHAEELLCNIGFFQAVGSSSRLDRLLGRLCYHACNHRTKNIYAASSDVFALLMETIAWCKENPAEYSSLVQNAISIMRERFAFLSGVEELAEELGVTKNHLIRTFTAETGKSPGKFLQSIKLDNAKLMLQNRDYSIEMVADMVGYSGSNYFCKVFRRVTGESPGEYRARNLKPVALDLENQRRLKRLESMYHV